VVERSKAEICLEDLLRCRQANFLHDSEGEASLRLRKSSDAVRRKAKDASPSCLLPPSAGGRRTKAVVERSKAEICLPSDGIEVNLLLPAGKEGRQRRKAKKEGGNFPEGGNLPPPKRENFAIKKFQYSDDEKITIYMCVV